MSQDNENKPGDFEWNPSAENLGSDAGTPFDNDNFDPFAEDDFSFGQPEAETASPQPESPDAEAPIEGLEDLPAPSSFLTGEAETGMSDEETAAADEEAAPEEAEEEPVDPKDKKKKKKKEKAKKEKKPKPEKKKKEKKVREPGDKEPIGLGGILSLVFGVLLLIGLIAGNVLLFLADAKDLGVGSSSVLYYLIGLDVIALIGIVSVPFLFYLYRKDIDVFKVGLGVSTMAMSLGVILLLTAFLRYDFTIKAPTATPSTDIPISAPLAPVAE